MPLPQLKFAPQVAVFFETGGAATFALDGLSRVAAIQVTRFADPAQMAEWIARERPAFVIFPILTDADFTRVVPVVQATIRAREVSPVKFMAISDLPERLANDPETARKLDVLKKVMEFFPLDSKCSDLLRQILPPPVDQKAKGYFLFKGKSDPLTFDDLVESYGQGVGIINRLTKGTHCALLAYDLAHRKLQIVTATDPRGSTGLWSRAWDHVVPGRDIITQEGHAYFQAVSSYRHSAAPQLTHGFIYLGRKAARLPLNTDEASLITLLADEIERLSKATLQRF